MSNILNCTKRSTRAEVAKRLKILKIPYKTICLCKEKRSLSLWLNTFLRFIGKLKKNPDKNPTPLAKKAEKPAKWKRV